MALIDCILKDRTVTELLIVQPIEALNKIISDRDRFTQAVLPIDSGVVDSEGTTLDEVLDSDQFKWLVAALGVGVDFSEGKTNGPPSFRIDLLRYGKIVIVVDKTAEGVQTESRVLALLRRFMLPLIAAGHVYTSPFNSVEASIDPGSRVLIPVL